MYLYVRIRVGLVESWHMYTTLHMVTDANFTWIDGGEGASKFHLNYWKIQNKCRKMGGNNRDYILK